MHAYMSMFVHLVVFILLCVCALFRLWGRARQLLWLLWLCWLFPRQVTHIFFHLLLLTTCIRVFIVVCMSRKCFKEVLKCLDPSSVLAIPWSHFPCLGCLQMVSSDLKMMLCKMFHSGYYVFKMKINNLNETPGWSWHCMVYVEWLFRTTW